ncbi:hypothetical protein E2C01_084098 [Portunus trituberculatus]|uniref:Uncharacterized protein n=1 Tax=Portunus trituberculatus TaxID=210409 RepID=A0A5B7J3Z0_PORTR|nr:hypothetical protein [Portunus trituberculatus]
MRFSCSTPATLLMWEVRYPAHVSHPGGGRKSGPRGGGGGHAVRLAGHTHTGTQGQGQVSQCVHSCAAPRPRW